MTTIDPRREADPANILEPTIEVWQNVTWADNYTGILRASLVWRTLLSCLSNFRAATTARMSEKSDSIS